ncbi:MAG: hypothetical protein AAF737_07310 [Pseudomonadota bacterium]
MRSIFAALRTTTFLIAICISLLTSTIAAGVWVVSLTAQVATVTAGAAAAAFAHRQAMARALARAKAKARLRRVMAAIPILGLGVAAELERRDYLEWKTENPDGDFTQYSCEIAALSAEVIDEVLQDLPEAIRPSRDTALAMVAPGGTEGCDADEPSVQPSESPT